MKFRDPKTGAVFTENRIDFCSGYIGKCDQCPLRKRIGTMSCDHFVRNYPKESGAIMGYVYLDDTSTDTSTDKLQYINSVYGRDEIFYQTTEESVELAQACDDLRRASMKLSKAVLKLRRAEHGTTPVSLTEATRNVLEECADVNVCICALEALGVFTEAELDSVVQEKLDRWEKRAMKYEKRVDRKP